jgi:hypothetical protein
MVSFNFEPWRSGTKIELCSETQCFELKDKEHRVHAFFRGNDSKVSATLVIDLQKNPNYEQYVKKMLEFAVPDLRLEDHKRFYKLYEHSMHLFALGSYANVLFDWEEDGITVRATVILQKGRVYTSVKVNAGPHHVFYQTQTEVNNDIFEYGKWLRRFLSDSARLFHLLKEYIKSGSASQ